MNDKLNTRHLPSTLGRAKSWKCPSRKSKQAKYTRTVSGGSSKKSQIPCSQRTFKNKSRDTALKHQTALPSPKRGLQAGNHDVLFGRGKRVNGWIGNLRYNDLVSRYTERYKVISKNKLKKQLTAEIVQEIHNQGGRFLREGNDSSLEEVTDEQARVKVGQALRHQGRRQELAHQEAERNGGFEEDEEEGEDHEEESDTTSSDGVLEVESSPVSSSPLHTLKYDASRENKKLSPVDEQEDCTRDDSSSASSARLLQKLDLVTTSSSTRETSFESSICSKRDADSRSRRTSLDFSPPHRSCYQSHTHESSHHWSSLHPGGYLCPELRGAAHVDAKYRPSKPSHLDFLDQVRSNLLVVSEQRDDGSKRTKETDNFDLWDVDFEDFSDEISTISVLSFGQQDEHPRPDAKASAAVPSHIFTTL